MLLLTEAQEAKITDEYEKIVFRYLRIETEKDEDLFNAACETKKTMAGIMNYIRNQAHEQAVKGCAVIPSETVFSWAKDYVMDEKLDYEKPVKKLKIKEKKLKSIAKTNEELLQEFYSNFNV